LECEAMKRSECNIIITKRELLLFKYLFETDFLTRDQIHNYIYPGTKQYFSTRLWQLTKEKYLKKLAHPLGKINETLIMADRKALDALKLHRSDLKTLIRKENFRFWNFNPEEDYSVQPGLDMRSFSHDILMNDIRFILENAGANYYRTNKMIGRERLKDIIPNGISFLPDALFEKRQKAYAVELETARKDVDRYKDIFNRYAAESSIDYVLYITDSIKVYNRVASLMNQKIINFSMDSYKKFYVIRLDDFLRGDWTFINPASEELKFNLKEVLR